jgi:hypothetical protein
MTTSSSFEIELRSGSRTIFQVSLDPLQAPFAKEIPIEVDAGESFSIRVLGSDSCSLLRLRLGSETLGFLRPGMGQGEFVHGPDEPPWLYNEFGETEVVLEEENPENPGRFEPVISVSLGVMPRPSVERAFRVMIRDIEYVHEGLAQDVVARSRVSRSLWGERAIRLNPEALIRALTSLNDRFQRVVERIERQPSMALVRRRSYRRYRPGDRVDPGALTTFVCDPLTKFDTQGRVAVVGKMLGMTPALTSDTPEHRHISQGLKRLVTRCRELRKHCDFAVGLLEEEKKRWGRRKPGEVSVFEKRELPRIKRLGELGAKAKELEVGFFNHLESSGFLREAGTPRTPLSPTPAFMGRPAYREAYHALVESRMLLGLMVDASGIGIGLRNLASLFEYWCFLIVVRRIRRILSTTDPESDGAFKLIHHIYRPELTPGQSFLFEGKGGNKVRVVYEPEYPPHRREGNQGAEFVASLTSSPLRPDILVEVRSDDSPPVSLVLDAKSTENFRTPRLFMSMADYRTQIFNPATGYQPVRQAWILHRDEASYPMCSLPGYLEGRVSGAQSSILGAIPCAPTATGRCPPMLEKVLDRFLEMTGVV